MTKYMYWFGFLMGIALALFGLPSLFTLDEAILHNGYILGEAFMYLSFIPQAAILWSLVLRKYVPVYLVTIPVGLLGLATWLHGTPNSVLALENNFIDYSEPRINTFSLAVLFIVLFIPVGFHFLQATIRQKGFKDRLVTFMLGMVFAGVGISTAGHLLVAGHAVSVASSGGNIVFFIFMLAAIAWPRQQKPKSVLPDVRRKAKT